MAAQPREAATLVLVREPAAGGGPPEVLLVRRGKGAGFGAGAHVFPGGVVEPADWGPAAVALSPGLTPARARERMPNLHPPEKALGFYLAAIRETFEEVGVLLARRQTGGLFLPDGQEQVLLAEGRARLNTGQLDFFSWIKEMELLLATETMTLFAHWITPEVRPKRFDTRFFIAPVPHAVEVSADGQEVFEHLWVSPREALRRNGEGEIFLMNPTVKNLETLAAFSGGGEMKTDFERRRISPVVPKIVLQPDGETRFVLPWEPDYHTI